MALANCGIRVGDSQVVIWTFLENPCMLYAVAHSSFSTFYILYKHLSLVKSKPEPS